MKDQVFSGRDVEEALAAASQALGVPREGLHYVVLDAGATSGRGLTAQPARVAVLMDRTAPPPPAPPAAGPRAEKDPRAGVRAVVRAIAEAAGVEVAAEIEETPDTLTVRIEGKDVAFFLDDDADVLEGLDHLLQRMYQRALEPRRLVVTCEGHRVERDEGLRQTAQELAEAVRRDGVPRTTRALNSYERRVVHVTLAAEPGIRTYSVGEEGNRRVTVAPREAGGEPGEPAGGG
ncbi:MAG TPA: R3H domain-containing nucleic acid-binding protein [Candidatus Dormibacteraeota bacterium]|nr:R3H domain-containing nucleic acid-binding protein [Candidatus Dormibacteraeota bacterium]